MNTAQPIRTVEDISKLKNYYLTVNQNKRNYLMLVFGLNTALRISDILKLKWEDVYDMQLQQPRTHVRITEQKTGKFSCIYLNKQIRNAVMNYQKEQSDCSVYIFRNPRVDRPISRVQAYRIIHKAAESCGLTGTISCHSLRKTFGYFAWQQGISPAMLMNIYNHSSYQITKRYLGIEQDDRDKVFESIEL